MARKGSSLSASLSLMQCFTALALILFTLASAAADASPALAPVCRVYQGFTLWSAAGLIMCCGAAAVDWGDRVGGALGRLVLPCFLALVVWSAVYAAVSVLLGGGRFTLAAFRAALLSAARGDTPSHLWILYILLGLYLVTPILGRFARSASRGELLYFLVLAFLFAGLLPVWSALHTNDVAARVKTHNEGKGAKYTKSRLPVRAVYVEEHETKHEAMSREGKIKRLSRAEKLRLIESSKA